MISRSHSASHRTLPTKMQRIMRSGASAVRAAVVNRASVPVSQVRVAVGLQRMTLAPSWFFRGWEIRDGRPSLRDSPAWCYGTAARQVVVRLRAPHTRGFGGVWFLGPS